MKKLFVFVGLLLVLNNPGYAQFKRITLNGAEISYPDRGKGQPIIFVHGALEDYRNWEKYSKELSKDFRVITYSRRYNYPGTNNMPSKTFSAINEAEDLGAFTKKLNLKRVHIIGHSFGSVTTLF